MTEEVPRQFEIEVPPDVVPGNYADFANVWHTSDVFVMDFVSLARPPQAGADADGNPVDTAPTSTMVVEFVAVDGGARMVVTSSAEWRGSSVASWRGQVTPMTRVLCAASMTSLVMVSSSLIFRTRSICGKSRSSSRKFPRVMRVMEAMACASVKSSGSRVLPSERQCRSRTNSSSSCPRGRSPNGA